MSQSAQKKRHRKKHHHRSHEDIEERPIPQENISVDVYEAKEKDQDNAEKATMDMIKEELSKEMGDDAGADSEQSGASYNPGQMQKLSQQMNRL